MTSDSERPVADRPATIDLNADLGEGCPHDAELLIRVSSASICCGAHAGSPASILGTLHAAARLGVAVGAHPGYPDREGFGRREQELSAGAVEELILDQVDTLRSLADEAGVEVRFLKPHGALYNQAQRQESIARGAVSAAARLGLPLLGQPGTLLDLLARTGGIRYVAEGFPDRRYRPDGSLAPRTEPGAVLGNADAIGAQVVRMVAERRFQTLCIHGDEPGAVGAADRVRLILEHNHIAIRNFLD